jgi:hypothetical protein
MSENMYFDDDDAPLDQDLKSERIPDPRKCTQTKTLNANDQGFSTALGTVKSGFGIGFDYTHDDVLELTALTATSTTSRTYEENKADSEMGVVAERVVQSFLADIGFLAIDTEHFEKDDGDLVIENSGTSIEVKSRTMHEAYSAGFDDFPVRHSGFSADIGVLCLVSTEKQKVVIVGWEHGQELAAWTRAYTPARTFNDDEKEGDDRWLYPYARTHSINTLHYILNSRR